MSCAIFKTHNRSEVLGLLLKADLKSEPYNYMVIDNAVYTSVYDAIIKNFHKTIIIALSTCDSIKLYFVDNKIIEITDIPSETMENLNNIFCFK